MLDMSTLEAHEVIKSRDNTYEFTRRIHLRPRKKVSSDILDFFEMIQNDYNLLLTIKTFMGKDIKTINPDLKINYTPVRMPLCATLITHMDSIMLLTFAIHT